MAAMTLVESSQAFVEAIEKSGLATPETTERIRELARNVEDPLSLAKRLVKDGTFTKWQAGQLMYGFHKLVIGKYKLLEQLGAGETGRVFLAEHVQMGRRHSLKMFSRKYTSQPDVLKQFLAEAHRVSGLEHRHISHVYDVNQEDERYYLVMEYVEGQNLQALVEKSGKLSPAAALDYMGQTAIGLAHAHANQVTHGDLKPSNLVLDGSGTVKILDLGQARLFAGAAATAAGDDGEDGEDAGVPAAAIHHAPEQRGGDRQVDERTDIYSLGSVLCFLLTAKTAESAATAAQNLAEVSGLPAEVRTLCTDLLATNPEDRPQPMQTVIERIAAAQQAASGAAVARPAIRTAPEHGPTKSMDAAPAKPKLPPRAKALGDSGAVPVARSLDKSADKSTNESLPVFVADDASPQDAGEAFGGFAIKTKGRVGKKPPVKAPAAAAAKPAAKAAPAEESAEADVDPLPAQKSYLPLIIGGSIGGGVLALAALGFIVFFLFFRGKPAEIAEAKTDTPTVAAEATSDPAGEGSEANPTEANPVEANPLAVAEDANPVAPPEAAPAPETTDKPPAPMPMATPAAPGAKTEPMPASPAVATTEPPPAAPATEPKPADPAATAKTDPPPTEPKSEPMPEPKPMPDPKPMPAAPPANPFVGFAKTVSLPKLPGGSGEVPADALAPVVLGPCKVDDKLLVIARLMGGESAAKLGKQKFDLKAANGGTALRDWEFTLEGGDTPLVVAKLSAKDGNLSFQWTPEGAKEQAAPFLMNCAIELSAGPGRHIVALRTPETGAPVVLDFDKATSNVKWVVENTPDPKHVHIQIVAVDGVPRKKFDPIDTLEGSGEDIIVWTGPADDTMVVGMKLTSAISGRSVQVNMTPQMKFEGMKRPEKFNKRTLVGEKQKANQVLTVLSGQLKSIPNRANDAALEQQKSLINQQIEALTKGGSQIDAVLEFMEAVKGQVQLQCRVFYKAGDTDVDLLVTAAGAGEAPKP